MQVKERFEKGIDKVREQGQPGVAEARAAKKVNRWRAAGVITASVLGGAGTMIFMGGVREGGFSGGVKAVAEAYASPFKNADGEFDMPFVDLPSIDFWHNENGIAITATDGIEPSELQPSDSNSELPTCPTERTSIEYVDGMYVSTAVYQVNEIAIDMLGGDATSVDALWQNYYTGDNDGANPNNPGLENGDTFVVRQLVSVEGCVVE